VTIPGSSTLILTAKTLILDPVLRDVGLDVAIPLEVEKECCRVKRSLDALMIRKALDESRIRVIAVKESRLVTKLQEDFGLGRGEAEATTGLINPGLTHGCLFASGHHGPTVDTFERERCSLVSVLSRV
jgi:hypothetical protein